MRLPHQACPSTFAHSETRSSRFCSHRIGNRRYRLGFPVAGTYTFSRRGRAEALRYRDGEGGLKPCATVMARQG